jgi:hypothetical protein
MTFRPLLTANNSSQDHKRQPGHQCDVAPAATSRPFARLHADTPRVPRLMTLKDTEVRDVTEGAGRPVNDDPLSVPDAASARPGCADAAAWLRDGGRTSVRSPAGSSTQAHGRVRQTCPSRIKDFGAYALSGARPGRYKRYMALVEGLRLIAERNGHAWTARDVDVALYWRGRPNQQPTQADPGRARIGRHRRRRLSHLLRTHCPRNLRASKR